MTHENITKDNILLNINLEVKEAFKTNEDLKDDWRKNANKYQVKISYFDKSLRNRLLHGKCFDT